MKGQFFVISTVIMIYALMTMIQYVYDFSDINLVQLKKMTELGSIQYIKDVLDQTTLSSNSSLDCNKVDIDLKSTEDFLEREMMSRGISLTISHTILNCPPDIKVNFDFSIKSSNIYIEATSNPLSAPLDLVGYWNFNEGFGTTASDSSNNGNDGTLYNMMLPDDMDGWTESVSNWFLVAGSGTISTDATDKKVGSSSVYADLTATLSVPPPGCSGCAEIGYRTSGTWDLTIFSKIYVWVKYDVKTATTYHDVSIFDSNGWWRWWPITASVVAGEWKRYEIDINSGYSQDASFNLASVKGIAVKTKNLPGGANQKIWVDGLYFSNWVSGKYGTALQFNGVDGRVRVPNDNSFDFTNEDFTVGLWFKNSYQIGYGYIFNKNYGAGSGTRWYGCAIVGSAESANRGKIRCYMDDGTNTVQLTTGGVYNDSVWHHVALRRDTINNKVDIFVDGTIDATATDTAGSLSNMTVAPENNLFIGVRADLGSQRWFNGTIDEVKIWNRSLTDIEISNEFI